jgi:lysozyme
MKTNKAGIKLLHDFESCQKRLPNGMLQAYKCPAGVWTIGWGNTFFENGTPVKEGDTITQEKADALFEFVLARFEEQAKQAITSTVNSNQFSAFVSALYNIGPGSKSKSGLLRLKNGEQSTLLKMINQNPNNPAIRIQFMAWISAGTPFENGLRRRRAAEADLYFSPINNQPT